tara:strand:- start:425 stop:1072 length:648 start_codon:yes stop_codon:yes gene_type:complete
MGTKERFTEIYENNEWKSGESKSGNGSELQYTNTLQKELLFLCEKYKIKTILDIPCGDYNWMQSTKLNDIEYIGADIVESMIENNRKRYPDVKFELLDITKDVLPIVDLVFVRDCLGHLSDDNIFKALGNLQKSGSRYLLSTSFTKWNHNPSKLDGEWKCINLMIEPYFLKPIFLINEDCTQGYPDYNDKCMVLFDLKDLHCGGTNRHTVLFPNL